MSKSRTSDLPASLWQLAQVLWVGGLWGVQVLMAPALERSSLAELLRRDVLDAANAWAVTFALWGIGVQLVILGWRSGAKALLRDRRAQLLWLALAAALAWMGFASAGLPPSRLGAVPIVALGTAGLLLVLWPAPTRREP